MFGSGEYPWMELMVGGLVAMTNLVIAIATLIAVLRHERAALSDTQPRNGLYERALQSEYLRGRLEGYDMGRGRHDFPPPPAAGGNG